MKPAILAWRYIGRDWRSGELLTLGLALVVAVAAITAVNAFTHRVELGLQARGAELLAGDLRISHSEPLPEELVTQAKARGLETARILTFPSVVFSGDSPVLVQVKAVDAEYPLRGDLRIQLSSQRTQTRKGPPAAGQAWVEQRLLERLGIGLGEAVPLGESEFPAVGIIDHEPDRGGDFFSIAPRLLMNMADLDATGLLGPAARVKHHLLIAGPAGEIAGFRDWAEQHLPRGGLISGLKDARPALRNALDQAKRFLSLAALVASLLAGAAVAIATRRYVQRQTNAAAVLGSLGATRRTLLWLFAIRVLSLGLVAAAIGASLGLLGQLAVAELLGNWLGGDLPAATLQPLLSGLIVGLGLLAGFALPPLLTVGRVPPLHVLRSEALPTATPVWLAWGAGLLVIAGLVLWQAGEPKVGLRVLGGALALTLILVGSARLLVQLTGRLRRRGGTAWRYGLAGLARRPDLTVLQVAGFGLGLMLILLLALVRSDLLDAWQSHLPPGTPNHFALNVQPDEVEAFKQALEDQGLSHSGLFPMIRGRLVRINGQEVHPEDYEELRARRLAAREFNLSFSEHLQSDNHILAGQWWSEYDLARDWFSVEAGIAKSLGLKLGDRITFEVASEPVSGLIASLREVRWESFNVNFFVMSPPGLMVNKPTQWITSFHLPDDKTGVIAYLAEQFPAVSIIDTRALIEQVRTIMAKGAQAVQVVFGFTLAAGLLVLVAAVQATREQRAKEAAILRTLGASRKRVLSAVAVEFASMGALAGLLGSAGAAGVGWVLAEQVFKLSWAPGIELWLAGLLAGVLGIGLAGVLTTWPLIRVPPIRVLGYRFAG